MNPSKDIPFNKTGNNINISLSDYCNLETVFVHEQQHKKNIENGVTENLQAHTQVYLNQIKDATLAKTTEDFQKRTVRSFSGYLLNYYARKATGVKQLEIFVSEFNKKNKSGYSTIVDVSSNDESAYKVDIYKKKKLVGSISCTEKADEVSEIIYRLIFAIFLITGCKTDNNTKLIAIITSNCYWDVRDTYSAANMRIAYCYKFNKDSSCLYLFTPDKKGKRDEYNSDDVVVPKTWELQGDTMLYLRASKRISNSF
jgi:hypothetical protein